MPCSGGTLNTVGMPYSRLTTKWSKPDNTALSISRTAITIGNTLKGLLVSSLHLLFKPADQWSDRQKQMVVILFGECPDRKTAYDCAFPCRLFLPKTQSRMLNACPWHAGKTKSKKREAIHLM